MLWESYEEIKTATLAGADIVFIAQDLEEVLDRCFAPIVAKAKKRLDL